jgi:hypothetical protein
MRYNLGMATPIRKDNGLMQGRPTKYKPEYDDQAFKYCLLGATDYELSEFFDVNEDTINEWKKVHPTFSESLKNGREIADANVAKSLYKRATGFEKKALKIFCDTKTGEVTEAPYMEYYPPDTTAINSWLNNRQRHKWKQRQDTTISGDKDNPLQIEATMNIIHQRFPIQQIEG